MSFAIKRVDWLVGSKFLAGIFSVGAALLLFNALVAFANELDAIGQGYTLGTAVTYVFFTLPRRLYEAWAMILLIGAMAGLGMLAPTQELTALRAGGISKARIVRTAVLLAAAAALIVAALGETLVPRWELKAQNLRAETGSDNRLKAGKSGVWIREGDTLINAKSGQRDDEGLRLHEVRIYEFAEKNRLSRLTVAKEAVHRAGQWRLHSLARHEFSPERVLTSAPADSEWRLGVDLKLLSATLLKPEYLAMEDLLANIKYLKANQLDPGGFEAAFWQRVFYPAQALLLMLLGLPLVFAGTRGGGFGTRLFFGIAIALGWHFSQRVLVSFATVYGIGQFAAQILTLAVLGLLVAGSFQRAR